MTAHAEPAASRGHGAGRAGWREHARRRLRSVPHHQTVRALLSPAVLQAAGLLVMASVAFAGVIRVPVFVDEANNVLAACLLTRGSLIYRDSFFHHFPLPYYLLAALGEQGACSQSAARYLGVLALTSAVGVFAWISRNPLAPLALLVLALSGPAYYAQRYLAETVISTGLILSLAMLTDGGHRLPRWTGHTLRFVALAILAWSSPIGLMMAGIVGPLMLVRAHGQRIAVIACGTLVLAMWPVFFAVQGAFQPFVEQNFLFNTQVYSKYLDVRLTDPVALLWQTVSFVRHRFSFAVDWVVGQETDTTVATYAAGLEIALVALLAALVVMSRRDTLFRLAVCLLFPIAVARDGFHLSPFITLASLGCAHLLGGVIGRSRVVQTSVAIVAILAVRVYFFFLPTDLNAPDELAQSLQPDPRILQHAQPSDTVLFLPMNPDGYLAHDRFPGSFYSFFLPWQAEIPGAEDRLIADIESNRVAVIVMDQTAEVWGKYQFPEYAPRVHAHILSTYRPVDTGDRRRARIFVRAEP